MSPGNFFLNLFLAVALSVGVLFLLQNTFLKPTVISPLAQDSQKLGGKEPSYYLDLANHFGKLDSSQIEIDLSAYQKRVRGECSSGQAIRAIDEEGEVTCEQVSSLTDGTGGTTTGVSSLSGGGGVLVNGTSGTPKTGALTLSTSGIPYSSLSIGNSIVTSDIKDATIATADLADSIVTGVKIADATITGSDLAGNISISTTGNLSTTGTGTLSIAGSSTLAGTTLANLTTTTGSFTSTVADSSSAIGFAFQTSTTYATAGAKLISIKNNSTEEFAIDKDGNLTVNGNLISTGTVTGTQLISTATGATPPLVVTSQTQVANLNASLLGGFTAAQLTGNLYNYLTNPGFEIWQRGAGPFTASAAITADQWKIVLNGTGTLQVDQESVVIETDSDKSAKLTHVIGTGDGSTRLRQTFQMSANSDFGHRFRGRVMTFSVRVRTSAVSAVRARISANGTGTPLDRSATHSGGDTFETLTASITVPSDSTSIEVSIEFPATATAYADNATLVIGSTAQTYYPLHPAEDMARAQRYYWKTSGVTLFPQVTGNATGAGQTWTTNILFPTPMAVTPTVTKSGTWEVSNMAQPTVDAASVEGFRLNGTSSAAGFLYSRPDSADDILTAEANP